MLPEDNKTSSDADNIGRCIGIVRLSDMIDEDIFSHISLYVGNKEPCWINHISGDLMLLKLFTACCLSDLIHFLGIEENKTGCCNKL